MIKRYKVVSIFIIICFLSAFIALYNGVTASNEIIRQINEQNKYQYVYKEEIMINFKNYTVKYEDLNNMVSNINESNISINDLSLFLDQTSVTHYPEIILKQNEDLLIPSKSNINNLPEDYIIIASNITKLNEVSSNGKKLKIYEVLDADKYLFLKGKMIIGAETYFKLSENTTIEGILNITFTSNKQSVYTSVKELETYIKNNYPNAEIYTLESTSNENIFTNSISGQSIISGGLFVFALLNTMIISYYLIYIRKKEIAIRKAFGFTNYRIIKMLMKDIGMLVIVSAGIAIILQLFIDLIVIKQFDFYNYITLLIPMLICIVLSILVAVIVPIRLVLKIDPAEGVKK